MLKKIFFPLLLLAILAGCATPVLQQEAVHGAVIETLQGSVNISLATSGRQISGNGVLFFKEPESFRLSILAPFGQVVFDIIVAGEKVLCLDEKRKTAWQGTVADLPASIGSRVWPLLSWTVEPPHPSGDALERFFKRPDGTVEVVYYDPGGFVQRKVNGFGDEVFYSDYRISGNRALPNRIEIIAADGSRLTLSFDDPELNQPIENGIFSPGLAGYAIFPLRELKGF